MIINSKLVKTIGIGAIVAALTATSAFARPAEATAPVNVRSGPGIGFNVVDRLHYGENVDISRRANGWCYVDKAGPNGWVSCAFLVADNGGKYRYRDRYDDRYNGNYIRPGVTFQFGINTDSDNDHHDHGDGHGHGNNGGWMYNN